MQFCTVVITKNVIRNVRSKIQSQQLFGRGKQGTCHVYVNITNGIFLKLKPECDHAL